MATRSPSKDWDPASRLFPSGALVFGFGSGGLADGIVLHQVLQWHNVASAQVTNETIDGFRSNLFWDGIFHLSTTLLLVLGIVLLWRAWESRRHGNVSALAGPALMGWGLFHAVDQLLFHELLGLHDIRQDAANTALYNWGFFLIGVLLVVAGWALWKARGRLGPSTPGRADADTGGPVTPTSRARR